MIWVFREIQDTNADLLAVVCQYTRRKEHSKRQDQSQTPGFSMVNPEFEESELEVAIINSVPLDLKKVTSTGHQNQ